MKIKESFWKKSAASCEALCCAYKIIHASGYNKLYYGQDDKTLPDSCPFNRKVLVNLINEKGKSDKNVTKAAKLLGLGRKGLQLKMIKYDLRK